MSSGSSGSLRGVGLKRGRYKGTWRSRYFSLPGDSSTLSYWEDEAAMLSGAKPRGELDVYDASALEDPEQSFCVSIHVSIAGAVGGVLRVAGVPSREEWIAFEEAEERDGWLAGLRLAARRRSASRRGFTATAPLEEDFEPDDSLWAEVKPRASDYHEDRGCGEERTFDRRPPRRLESACVYDYSIARCGWRAVVTYHVQATGYGRLEPWVVRKTHADFKQFVSSVESDTSAPNDDDENTQQQVDPQRLLSVLGRRVDHINAVLRRIVADQALSRSPELEAFLGPPPDAACRPPRQEDDPLVTPAPLFSPPATSSATVEGEQQQQHHQHPDLCSGRRSRVFVTTSVLPLVPSANLAAALGAVAVLFSHRVYSVPPALLAAVFAAGAVVGARLVAVDLLAEADDRRDDVAGAEDAANASPSKQRFDNEDLVVVDSRDATATVEDESDSKSSSSHCCSDYSLQRWPSPLTSGGHCWSEPDASFFRVRGQTYLDDRVKVPSGGSLFPLAAVDLFLTDVPQQHVARHPGAFISRRRRRGDVLGSSHFAVNFCMPWGNLVAYWAREKKKSREDSSSDDDDDGLAVDQCRGEDDAAHTVFERFVNGDDAYRDARLKLIPRVVEGNWIVRRAVGAGTNAAKLSEAVKLSYFQGPDYFEVDLDIVGSPLARRILSVVRSATSTLVLDLALVIEGVSPDELPERILGAVRMHRVNPNDAPILEALE